MEWNLLLACCLTHVEPARPGDTVSGSTCKADELYKIYSELFLV